MVGLQALVEFCDVRGHQLDLHRLLFHVRSKADELVFSFKQLLVLLFIHRQISLGVAFDCFFLVLQH